eukprot:TRINITY_DN5262_c0_g1_i3.p1 TRINITY_DN5262_c0_g1~~TRINITY_DN5262_c0_g1_i3.p1  ORF type:complete len:520 (+),score=86.98 TRINITY_DN5262_c0_g1_i3:155-1714(+)
MAMLPRLGRRSAKMVATLGPASSNPEVFRAMVKAGVDVVRLNFSHGTHEMHKKKIKLIRAVSEEMKRPVAILQDLCGPKIRTSPLFNDIPIQLTSGQLVSIIATLDPSELWGSFAKAESSLRHHYLYNPRTGAGGNTSLVHDPHPRIGTTYQTLHQDVKSGDTILLSDGLIHLRCIEVRFDKREVICEVVHGGVLKSSQGINLPNVKLSTSCITEKDVADLRFGLENEVDFVAASFVRTAEDVLQVKRLIGDMSSQIVVTGKRYLTPVIAKIEKPEALTNIESIIEAADGIMVARGDLGVELPPQQVPVAQKRLISLANQAGVPVIVATQMLESMIQNPRPTRAEVSDVCNAIFDGADATMLSAETASGAFPVEALKMMVEIAEIADANQDVDKSIAVQRGIGMSTHSSPIYQAIGHAAYAIASTIDLAAIVTFTNTGDTARMIARDRPKAPVVALTPNIRTVRQLNLVKNVYPFLVRECHSLTELTEISEEIVLREGFARIGSFSFFFHSCVRLLLFL